MSTLDPIYASLAEQFLARGDTGKIDERPVNATRNPWIYDSETRYLKGGLWIGSKFIWEKDALGRDKLVFPEMLAPVGK